MKRLSLPRKFSFLSPKVLGLTALFLAVMALSTGVVTGGWGILPSVLLSLAGVLLLAWLVVQSRVSQGFWGRRSTQAGANNLLSLLAVIVLLGIINFLGARYSTQFDFSEGAQFSLAPESRDVLQSLEQPVTVLVFDDEPDDGSQRLLLEQFRQASQGQVTYEFINPTNQPGLARKYNVQTRGTVILESGNRSEPLEGELREADLTPALIKVTSDSQTRAYFTQGHGELPLSGGSNSLSQAMDVLNKRNVETLPLTLLANPEVPEDANVVVVAGPKQAFLAPEVNALEAYLQRGGSLLVMVDPDVNSGLEPLLNDWGIKLDNRWIIDGSGVGAQVGLGPDTVVAFDYGQHPITQRFAQGPSLFPQAQAILIMPQDQDEVVDLVSSGPQTWAEANPQADSFNFDEGQDQAGPLTLGVAITRPLSPANTPEPAAEGESPAENPEITAPGANQSETTPKDARLVVFGDSGFAADSLFEQGVNGDLLVNSILWLGERQDQPLSIRPKETTNRRLNLSVDLNRWVTLISVVILPLLGFGLAIGAWWRRR